MHCAQSSTRWQCMFRQTGLEQHERNVRAVVMETRLRRRRRGTGSAFLRCFFFFVVVVAKTKIRAPGYWRARWRDQFNISTRFHREAASRDLKSQLRSSGTVNTTCSVFFGHQMVLKLTLIPPVPGCNLRPLSLIFWNV